MIVPTGEAIALPPLLPPEHHRDLAHWGQDTLHARRFQAS